MTVQERACPDMPGIAIIALTGRLGITAEQDLAHLTQALTQCETGLLLDMSGVEFVSSAGLRALMKIYKEAEGAGKTLAMMQVQPDVYKIFKLTACERLFRIFDDEAAARQGLTMQGDEG